MEWIALTPADEGWNPAREYAQNCSWRAGQALAEAMDRKAFTGWERVIIVLDGERICGFCTVSATDCIPDLTYTPYIGYVFVDEAYRGRRLSQQLIRYAMNYLRQQGFEEVYLISDHENLYEKYGFCVVDRQLAPWGSEEKIYRQTL